MADSPQREEGCGHPRAAWQGAAAWGAGVQEGRGGRGLEAPLASAAGGGGSVGTRLGGFILQVASLPRQLTLLRSPRFPGSSGSLNICILKVNV